MGRLKDLGRRIVGEISVLREATEYNISRAFLPRYTLDSTRVNYGLARELYRNSNDKYKLGAGFAKPIVNVCAGFMGVPRYIHEDETAQQFLTDTFERRRWASRLLMGNRDMLRDGDCWARLAYVADKYRNGQQRFDLCHIAPEWVTAIPDPVNGGYAKVVIRYPVKVPDDQGRVEDFTVTETWSATTHTVEVDTRAPQWYRDQMYRNEANKWGFIPLVHFKNEVEANAVNGFSELEAVEPFFKAYHDVAMNAAQGSKLFSRPKATFSVKSIQGFLQDNFTPQELAAGKLRFQDKELFLLKDGDTAQFLTADPGLAGITTLMEFLYYCIVDTSETPEFVFGTAVSSSKASVSEQMVPLAVKVERKRGMVDEPHTELAAMALAMGEKAGVISGVSTYDVDTQWQDVNPKDEKSVADAVGSVVTGLVAGVETGLLSVQSASEFLREFVPTMQPFVDNGADEDEKRRIIDGLQLLARIKDQFGYTQEPGGPQKGQEGDKD